MRAVQFIGVGRPLQEVELETPEPGVGEVALEVSACGVCRTDLHILDGELTEPKLPLVLGHQIVGDGPRDRRGRPSGSRVGDRVGVPWLGWTVRRVPLLPLSGRENLCDRARFTGYDIDGGYAELTVADERFCFPIPERLLRRAGGAAALRGADRLPGAAPGRRRASASASTASAPPPTSSARSPSTKAASLRLHPRGRRRGQAFARGSGRRVGWSSGETPPEELDGAIVFAPGRGAGAGGAAGQRQGRHRVISAGIHMSDIPAFPYKLFGRNAVSSDANLTRRDGEEFMSLASQLAIRPNVTAFALSEAQSALDTLREGSEQGAVAIQVATPA